MADEDNWDQGSNSKDDGARGSGKDVLPFENNGDRDGQGKETPERTENGDDDGYQYYKVTKNLDGMS